MWKDNFNKKESPVNSLSTLLTEKIDGNTKTLYQRRIHRSTSLSLETGIISLQQICLPDSIWLKLCAHNKG